MRNKQVITQKRQPSSLAKNFFKGIGEFLGFIADMERKGVSQVVEEGEMSGKTKEGKDIKVKYGYGVKIGLDDFVKKLRK